MHYWQRKTQAVTHATLLPDCLLNEVEPGLTSESAARSLLHSGVWAGAMHAVFDGLQAVDTFAAISDVPAGSNIVELQRLLKWKGDEYGMIVRANARVVAKDNSQVERVDCFDTFAPTASATSSRLVAATAGKLD